MSGAVERVVLTGCRASGKTTVGRRLAELLGWEFVDTDAVIKAAHGDIAALVAREGWPRFRAIERELLFSLAGSGEKVIATGGGAVMHQDAWEELRQNALVVWLRAGIDTVRARLAADPASKGQRPSLTGADPIAEIAAVMAEREPLYRQGSDLTLDAARPVEEIVAEIVGRLGSYLDP